MESGPAASGQILDRRRAGVLVIADDHTARAAQAAVAAGSGRLLGCVGWNEATERLDQQGTVSVVLAEASGIDDLLLDRVLPKLDRLAQGDTHVIAALDVAQIDVVAASLIAPGTELLCDPTVLDRVAALSLATATDGDRVSDVARDAVATRLRHVHEEVARIAETLAKLTRGDAEVRSPTPGRGVEDPGLAYRAQPGHGGADITAREIRDAIRARRLRDDYFGAGLFEDPAWDMLLDLFAAELERAQVSVSSLCIAAAVAPTTALRWIARMTDAGLLERQPDPFDRRRAFMGLSRRASAAMRTYITTVRRTGAAVA